MTVSVASRVAALPKATVWSEFTPLAARHGAVNLGQGFPSWAPEPFVAAQAAAALASPDPMLQQYAPPRGRPELVEWVAERYSALLGAPVGPANVQVTNGSTQAINLVAAALVSPGEEVIVIEPFFDLYTCDVHLAHGVVRHVPLRPDPPAAGAGDFGGAGDWRLDMAELRAAVSPGKTKLLLLNTPQNAPGKVWRREELEAIAELAAEAGFYILSDEVYDRLTFDGREHLSIAALPAARARTVVCSSAGKALSVTGWKVGWAVAPNPALALAVAQVAAMQTFSVCTPLQVAVAAAMREAAGNGYFPRFVAGYAARREALLGHLRAAGLRPVVPEGSFFIVADISAVDPGRYRGARQEGDEADIGDDWLFCRWLTATVGVAAIPMTAFCSREHRPLFSRFARFAFCKSEADIEEAGRRLRKHLAL